MTVDFKLPDLGEGLHEAEIISVKVKEGDVVEEDQPLFEVETDKAVIEIPSPYKGTIAKIHVKEGDVVAVGSVMVSFEKVVAEIKEKSAAAAAQGQKSASGKAPAREASPIKESAGAAVIVDRAGANAGAHGPGHAIRGGGNGRSQHDPDRPVPAAPAVRKLARELGVDLYAVAGSGPSGRVMKEDVRAHAAGALKSTITEPRTKGAVKGTAGARSAGRSSLCVSPTSAEAAPAISLKEKYGGQGEGTKFDTSPIVAQPVELPDFERFGKTERVPLRSIRRKIAQNMTLSWTHIPHVTHFDEADVTELARLIAKNEEKSRQLKEQGTRITLTAFTVKAVVSALKKYPQFNSSLDESKGEIVFKHYYNLGIAVATERGLIVPNIQAANEKTLIEIANDLKEIADKTRSGKIELERLQGSTFTITNIGAIGGTSMVPMINYPEAAILGMARASERPMVRDGKIEAAVILPLSLSFDHRLADGAEAAFFVRHIIDLLENPLRLIVE